MVRQGSFMHVEGVHSRLLTVRNSVRETLLEAVSPTRCVCCERPGALVCEACLQGLATIDPALSCTRCAAPFGYLLCTECQAGLEEGVCLPGLEVPGRSLAALEFDPHAASIVRAYKDAGELRLSTWIAQALLDAALHAEAAAPDRYGGLLTEADAIVFVPATAEAYRRRGFDHMERIARELACETHLPLVDALLKHGSADQRKEGRRGRFSAARDAYEVVEDVRGARLLLIDDVMTTGATMGVCAEVLHEAGAESVERLALARVW